MSSMQSLFALLVHICGALAPTLSIIVFLSPLPTIYQIYRDELVGSLPLLPYTSMVGSTYLWVVYGVLQHETPIIVANFPGLVLATGYVIVYVKYARRTLKVNSSSSTLPGSILQHYIGMASVIGISSVIPFLLPLITSSIQPAAIVGMGGVVLCIILFASPLAALRTVLANQSAKSIPLPFTIMTVFNCFAWSIYGLWSTHDPNVYIPNLLGLSFGIIQVLLKLLFYHNDYVKYHHVEHDDVENPSMV